MKSTDLIDLLVRDYNISLSSRGNLKIDDKIFKKFKFTHDDYKELSTKTGVEYGNLVEFVENPSITESIKKRLLLIESEKQSKLADKFVSTFWKDEAENFKKVNPKDYFILKSVNASHGSNYLYLIQDQDYFGKYSRFKIYNDIDGSGEFLNTILESIGDSKLQGIYKSNHVRSVVFDYMPYTTDQIINPEGVGLLTKFNMYNPPEYRLLSEYKNAEVDEDFISFMEVLIPSEFQREEVYKWMYNATFFRSSLHLLMHGKKGVGKGMLGELMQNLVGKENAAYVQADALDNDFDSAIRDKTFAFYDEADFSKKRAKNKLKMYINDEVTLHEKFRSAHKSSRLFASLYVANNYDNYDSGCHFTLDERIFLVPDLHVCNLVYLEGVDKDSQERSRTKIANFKEKFTNPEFLAGIANFLISKYGGQEAVNQRVIVTETYKKLAYESLVFWQRAIIDIMKTEDELSYVMLKEKIKELNEYRGKGLPSNIKRIKDFINEYKNAFDEEICTIEEAPGFDGSISGYNFKSSICEKEER